MINLSLGGLLLGGLQEVENWARPAEPEFVHAGLTKEEKEELGRRVTDQIIGTLEKSLSTPTPVPTDSNK